MKKITKIFETYNDTQKLLFYKNHLKKFTFNSIFKCAFVM